MKTFIVVLSLAAISLSSYNEEGSQTHARLKAPKINTLRLKSVPGCGYLKPIFIYEILGVKQAEESRADVSVQTISRVPVNNAIPFLSRTKWFYDDPNTVFISRLKVKNREGC